MFEPQPRIYRVRVYDRDMEALTDRRYPAVLDLTAGPALLMSEAKLDALLFALAYAHGARGEKVRNYRLRVETWPTEQVPQGVFVFDWPGKTWPVP